MAATAMASDPCGREEEHGHGDGERLRGPKGEKAVLPTEKVVGDEEIEALRLQETREDVLVGRVLDLRSLRTRASAPG